MKNWKITKFSVRISMNIHHILRFGSKFLIPNRLWRCKKMFPKKLSLHPSSVHIHKSLFKNLIWSMSFILLWSVKHLDINAKSQDGSDIYGFPKRKWSLNVTYFYFAINITCFSLVQVSSFESYVLMLFTTVGIM